MPCRWLDVWAWGPYVRLWDRITAQQCELTRDVFEWFLVVPPQGVSQGVDVAAQRAEDQ